MKKRLILVTTLCLALALIVSGCSSDDGGSNGTSGNGGAAASGDSTETITVRLGHSSTETNIVHIAATAFKEKAEELLGDRVNVVIFPNASLGSQTEMIESMQMGTLDGVVFGRHSQIDARLDVLNLPFLFESEEHMTMFLRGEEGAPIRELVAERFEANGIVMLGMFEAGFRNITSSKRIESLDDLVGLVIRTPNTDVLMDSFRAWGANPTPIDLGELYTALQTKVADAQENPFQLIYSNAYYEVQDYLCITNHSTICDQFQFSKIVWDSYPADIQEAFLEAAQYAVDAAGEASNQQNRDLLAELENHMEVTYMPEAEIARMREIAMAEVWPKYMTDELSSTIVEMILDLVN